MANLQWSPAGNALAFTAQVHLDDSSFDETASKLKSSAARAFQVFDELMVRSWDAYVPETRSHLFVVPLEHHDAESGDDAPRWQLAAPPRDLMRGVDADCPTHATFGGCEQVDINIYIDILLDIDMLISYGGTLDCVESRRQCAGVYVESAHSRCGVVGLHFDSFGAYWQQRSECGRIERCAVSGGAHSRVERSRYRSDFLA